MFGGLFGARHIGRALSLLSRVDGLIERADIVSYEEWLSRVAHTQLFPYAFNSSSSDRLGLGTTSSSNMRAGVQLNSRLALTVENY
jgi:hypothetical protein